MTEEKLKNLTCPKCGARSFRVGVVEDVVYKVEEGEFFRIGDGEGLSLITDVTCNKCDTPIHDVFVKVAEAAKAAARS